MPDHDTISSTHDLPFRVADGRKRGYFTVDNVLLDVYGAQLGPYAIAVYCALARHADADSECWPSYRTITQRTGVSRSQVIRELDKLVALGIISVTHRCNDKGERIPHLYTLLDIVEGGSTVTPPDPTVKRGGSTVTPRTIPTKKGSRSRERTGRDYVPAEYADIIIH